MRLLFLGDIVGRSGRDALVAELPGLRRQLRLDFVIVNGENAAGGFGITGAICDDVFDAGADVITLGNHSWDQREALVHIEREPRLIRPVNYPSGTPGRGATLVESASGARVLVVNALGRVFTEALDCPFEAVDRHTRCLSAGAGGGPLSSTCTPKATSEKMAMGHFCDGRASLVVGTHSHVPTADARYFPAVRRTRRMPVCAATTIRSSAWKRTSRSTASPPKFQAGAFSKP